MYHWLVCDKYRPLAESPGQIEYTLEKPLNFEAAPSGYSLSTTNRNSLLLIRNLFDQVKVTEIFKKILITK